MVTELIFDTDARTTADRLKELQEKGVTLEASVTSSEKISLVPERTKIYDDGFETSVEDLKHGIGRDIPPEGVKARVDMVLYSAHHRMYYQFRRMAEFIEEGIEITGYFKFQP